MNPTTILVDNEKKKEFMKVVTEQQGKMSYAAAIRRLMDRVIKGKIKS